MHTIILPKTQHLVIFQQGITSSSGARQPDLTQAAMSKIIQANKWPDVEQALRKKPGITLTSAEQNLHIHANKNPPQYMSFWRSTMPRKMPVDERRWHR